MSILLGVIAGAITALLNGAIAYAVIRGLKSAPVVAGSLSFVLLLALGYLSSRLLKTRGARHYHARTLVGIALLMIFLPPSQALWGLSFLPAALGAVLSAARAS